MVTHVVEVEKPLPPARLIPNGERWAQTLERLARQIDSGRVYDRDLPDLARPLEDVLVALNRRSAWRRRAARLGVR